MEPAWGSWSIEMPAIHLDAAGLGSWNPRHRHVHVGIQNVVAFQERRLVEWGALVNVGDTRVENDETWREEVCRLARCGIYPVIIVQQPSSVVEGYHPGIKLCDVSRLNIRISCNPIPGWLVY